jgi:hypothetical protein
MSVASDAPGPGSKDGQADSAKGRKIRTLVPLPCSLNVAAGLLYETVDHAEAKACAGADRLRPHSRIIESGGFFNDGRGFLRVREASTIVE